MTRLAASAADTRSDNACPHAAADVWGSPLLNAIELLAIGTSIGVGDQLVEEALKTP